MKDHGVECWRLVWISVLSESVSITGFSLSTRHGYRLSLLMGMFLISAEEEDNLGAIAHQSDLDLTLLLEYFGVFISGRAAFFPPPVFSAGLLGRTRIFWSAVLLFSFQTKKSLYTLSPWPPKGDWPPWEVFSRLCPGASPRPCAGGRGTRPSFSAGSFLLNCPEDGHCQGFHQLCICILWVRGSRTLGKNSSPLCSSLPLTPLLCVIVCSTLVFQLVVFLLVFTFQESPQIYMINWWYPFLFLRLLWIYF